MDRCANSEALSRYEDEVTENELRYEKYQEEVEEACGKLCDKLIETFNEITDKYGYDVVVTEYIEER